MPAPESARLTDGNLCASQMGVCVVKLNLAVLR